MTECELKELHERVGYKGKSQQWQYGFDLAIRELTNREGYKLVPVCDYNELVRSNRYRQKVNIKLTEEVKILRERKKFYKSELKRINDNFKLLPIEPTNEVLKFLGGTKQEATMIYKAMINAID